MEDRDRSLEDITREAVKNSMRGVMDYLEYTYERGDDFEDGWLPTLDVSLKVDQGNQIQFKYFENPPQPTPPLGGLLLWLKMRKFRASPMTLLGGS